MPGGAKTLTLDDKYLDTSDGLIGQLEKTIFDPLIAEFGNEPNTWSNASLGMGFSSSINLLNAVISYLESIVLFINFEIPSILKDHCPTGLEYNMYYSITSSRRFNRLILLPFSSSLCLISILFVIIVLSRIVFVKYKPSWLLLLIYVYIYIPRVA